MNLTDAQRIAGSVISKYTKDKYIIDEIVSTVVCELLEKSQVYDDVFMHISVRKLTMFMFKNYLRKERQILKNNELITKSNPYCYEQVEVIKVNSLDKVIYEKILNGDSITEISEELGLTYAGIKKRITNPSPKAQNRTETVVFCWRDFDGN